MWIKFNTTSKYWESANDPTDPASLFTQLDVSADAIVSGNLAVARMPLGGTWTLTSDLTIADKNVRVIEPVISSDVATKGYVDVAVQSLEIAEYFTNTASSLGGSIKVMQEAQPSAGTISSAALGSTSANDILALEFATVAGEPNLTFLAAAIYELHLHAYFTTAGGAPKTCSTYWKLFKIDSTGGTEVLVMTSATQALSTTAQSLEIYATLAAQYTIPNLTDRLLLRFYINVVGAGPATCTLNINIGGTNNSHFSIELPSAQLPHIFLPYSGAQSDTNTGAYKIQTAALGVGAAPSSAGIVLPDSVPSPTTNALYNDGGTLKFNGSDIGATVPADVVVESGSYANPTWITSLAQSKIATLHAGAPVTGTSSTSEQNLQSVVLPGGTLATDGDAVRITTVWKAAANGNTKRWRLYFGSTLIADSTAAAWNNVYFTAQITVTRTGATSQLGHGFIIWRAAVPIGDYTSGPAETLANNITIKTTGTGSTTGADLTSLMLTVEILKD